ncbi:hypothetical protein GEMRC1_002106 [Eukaryota sp. GEM-RC1]
MYRKRRDRKSEEQAVVEPSVSGIGRPQSARTDEAVKDEKCLHYCVNERALAEEDVKDKFLLEPVLKERTLREQFQRIDTIQEPITGEEAKERERLELFPNESILEDIHRS